MLAQAGAQAEQNDGKLVQGWLVVDSGSSPRESRLLTWKARELKDCEEDLKTFLTDLKSSFKSRFQQCISPMQNDLTSLDLDSIVSLQMGSRSANGIVRIDEAALECFKTEEFRRVFQFICSLRHAQRLALKDVTFAPTLSSAVYRKLKMTIKELVWNPKWLRAQTTLSRLENTCATTSIMLKKERKFT